MSASHEGDEATGDRSDGSPANPNGVAQGGDNPGARRGKPGSADRKQRSEAMLIGMLVPATIAWIALFCAGATIETELARLILAPLDTLSKQRDDQEIRRLAALAGLEIQEVRKVKAPNTDGQPSGDSEGSADGSAARRPVVAAALVSSASESEGENSGPKPSAIDDRSLGERLAAWAGKQTTGKAVAFVTCLACYSPINIALLSVMAGLIGGCASNLYYDGARSLKTQGAAETVVSPQDAARDASLSENPAISAVRGLVGYILILAGVYAVFDDPFKNPTTSQYAKLAGFSSALAFTLGYDGTSLTRLLESFSSKQQKADGPLKNPGS